MWECKWKVLRKSIKIQNKYLHPTEHVYRMTQAEILEYVLEEKMFAAIEVDISIALLYKSKKWYFLDSYGRTLTDDTFSNSFVKVIKDYTGGKLVYNKQWLQQITSNVCGQYSVYFITEMQYKKLGDVLKVFTTNLAKNDSFVRNYVK